MVADLEAQPRAADGTSAARRLRAAGRVPAIIYGHGQAAVPIQVERAPLDRILAAGEHLVALRLDGGERQAIFKEVQVDPLSQQILHVDFQEVRTDEEVTLSVRLRFRGTPAGATDGGVADHLLHEIDVRCLATRIPDEIVVDVSALGIGDDLRASDLPLPEGVAIETAADKVVAHCRKPIEEAEAPPEEAEAPAAPEVITEKKPETETEDQT